MVGGMLRLTPVRLTDRSHPTSMPVRRTSACFRGPRPSYRPLQPVWTCQQLEVRPTGASGHRYYGRCSIGDAAARERWVEQVRVVRLVTLRDLSIQVKPGSRARW